MRTGSRVAFTLAMLALAVLVPTAAASWFFPDAKSPVQREWQALFTTVFWAALVVFVVVEGLLLYALIRFRRREGGPQEGPHIHGHTKMEVAWTIAPTLVMAWLLVVSLNQLDRVDNGPQADFVIEVVGHQFYWEFFYPPNFRESTTGTLYVEEDRVVGLRVTATDVIHAFNIPELGVMIDAMPGRTNEFWFLAEDPGTYAAQCRELCGVGHGRMKAEVVVFAADSQDNPYGPPPEPTPTAGPETTNETAPANTTAPAGDVSQRVVLDSFSIAPEEFTSQPGQKLLLEVENVAPTVHNLYIGKWDQSNPEVLWSTKDLGLNEKEFLEVDLPAEAGAWEWWCNVQGHKDAGMYGVLSTGGQLEGGARPILPGPGPLLILAALGGAWVLARRRHD